MIFSTFGLSFFFLAPQSKAQNRGLNPAPPLAVINAKGVERSLATTQSSQKTCASSPNHLKSTAKKPFAWGDGSSASPFAICTVEQLKKTRHIDYELNPEPHFALHADLDLTGFEGRVYSGKSFDGNHHTLSNYTVDGVGPDSLFGYIWYNSVLQNLTLKNFNILGYGRQGYGLGIVVTYNYGLIKNVKVIGGSIRNDGDYPTASLASRNEGIIENSFSSASVDGRMMIGGLTGMNGGTITRSSFMGTLNKHNGEGVSYMGGIAGYIHDPSNIYDCFVRATFYNSTDLTGGIAGLIDPTPGQISRTYSASVFVDTFPGSNPKGVAESDEFDLPVKASFWDATLMGLSPEASPPSQDSGRSTAQMKTRRNYESKGWDFTSVWSITEGQYPELRPVPKK